LLSPQGCGGGSHSTASTATAKALAGPSSLVAAGFSSRRGLPKLGIAPSSSLYTVAHRSSSPSSACAVRSPEAICAKTIFDFNNYVHTNRTEAVFHCQPKPPRRKLAPPEQRASFFPIAYSAPSSPIDQRIKAPSKQGTPHENIEIKLTKPSFDAINTLHRNTDLISDFDKHCRQSTNATLMKYRKFITDEMGKHKKDPQFTKRAEDILHSHLDIVLDRKDRKIEHSTNRLLKYQPVLMVERDAERTI
jgi:hypothetical protein